MLETLLAKHDPHDRVAYGDAGERTAAQLLRDAAAVARALPDPCASRQVVVVGVRRDAYACVAALLGAWAKGFVAALAPPEVTREGFLRLSQRYDVAAVIHDTASTAALPIADLLAGAALAPEPALPQVGFVAEAQLWWFTAERSPDSPPLRVRGAQLLREAALVGSGLGLPEHGFYACSLQPDTRPALTLGVLWPLLSGGAFLRDDPRAPEWPARLGVRGPQPPVLVSVPAQIRALWAAPGAPLSRVASVISAGASLPAAAFDALQRIGLPVHDVYSHPRYGCLGWRNAPSCAFRPLRGLSLRAAGPGEAEWLAVAASHLPEQPAPTIRARLDVDGVAGAEGVESIERIEAEAIARARGFHACGVGSQRSAWEEQIGWIEGIRDAALLDVIPPEPATAEPEPESASRWLLALVLDADLDAPAQDALRARIARELPELKLAQLRCATPLSSRRVPAAAPTFSTGAGDLWRDGAGRHDRVGVLRWFDMDRDGRPLSWSLEQGREHSSDAGFRCELRVPPRYGYFAGHFPGYPILPGAAQLSALVLPCVRRSRPQLGKLVKMARVKFQERIVPGDSVEVCLTFAPDPACVDFSLRRGDNVCASGRLWFEPAAAAGTEPSA